MEQWWTDTDTVKLKNSEKTFPTPTLSTTNPTWSALGMNLGFHDEKPATNSLSYGMALLDYCYGVVSHKASQAL
jgi:hypothetical protein